VDEWLEKSLGDNEAGAGLSQQKSLFNLWAPRRESVEVKVGDRFCRRRRDRVMETAAVDELRPDSLGIPHVHFRLTFEEPAIGRVEAGRRVLALNSFVEAYHQRA
jgi:hypothetical protein